MTKQYKPCGNRVLIKKLPVEEKTKSGIILQTSEVEQQKHMNTYAEVLSIGYNVDKTFGLKVGDKIAFAKYSETVLDDEEQIATVKDENIQAIIYEVKK